MSVDSMILGRDLDGEGSASLLNMAKVTLANAAANADEAVRYQEFDSAVTALQGRATTLEGKMTTAEGDITTLQGKVTTVEGKMTTAEGDITTLQGKVTTVEGKMTTAEGEIVTLQGDVQGAKSDIDDLQANVTAITDSVAGKGSVYEGAITFTDANADGILEASMVNPVGSYKVHVSVMFDKGSGNYAFIEGDAYELTISNATLAFRSLSKSMLNKTYKVIVVGL